MTYSHLYLESHKYYINVQNQLWYKPSHSSLISKSKMNQPNTSLLQLTCFNVTTISNQSRRRDMVWRMSLDNGITVFSSSSVCSILIGPSDLYKSLRSHLPSAGGVPTQLFVSPPVLWVTMGHAMEWPTSRHTHK